MSKEKILVFGAGSLGTFLAVMLKNKGYDVELLESEKIKYAKEKKHIFINDKKYKLPKIIKNIKKNDKYDYIFLTTKLYDLEKAVKEIKEKEISFKNLISVHNVLFDDLFLFDIIKNKPISLIAVLDGHYLNKDKIKLSPYKGWFIEDNIMNEDIYNILKNSGINIKKTKDLRKVRAEKTVMNCALNALSALENKSFKEMFKSKSIKQRIKKIFNESYDVLSEIVKMSSKRTLWTEMREKVSQLDHYSSTWQDIKNKKETEIPFLNAYIVTLAEKFGKDAKENKALLKEFYEKYPTKERKKSISHF